MVVLGHVPVNGQWSVGNTNEFVQSKSMASIDGRVTTHVDISNEVGVTAVKWRSRTGK